MELSWENQLTNGDPVENSSIKLWTPDNDSGIPVQRKNKRENHDDGQENFTDI
jgi:hypothetical protein